MLRKSKRFVVLRRIASQPRSPHTDDVEFVTLPPDDPVAAAAAEAVRTDDAAALRRLLADHSWLATARIGDDDAAQPLLSLGDAAAMGLDDTVTALLHVSPSPGYDEIDFAFWTACRRGRLRAAEILFRYGAQLNRCPPWAQQTPLDAAVEGGAEDLAQWLRTLGGTTAGSLRPWVTAYARRTR